MECLASFVVLFVLPLAAAAFVIAWRARKAALGARKETEALAKELTALTARLGTAGVAPGPAATVAAPMPSPLEAAAPTPALETPLSAMAETAPAAVSVEPSAAETLAAAAGSPALGSEDVTLVTPAAASAADGGAPPPSAAPPASLAPPPPRPSLEERLGARLPVWIGAVSLIIAAAFLVKYSADQGFIGPTVRVTLGILFGIGLLGAGEFMRKSSAWVAQGLSAAGIAVLFIVELAAVHLYHLIGAPTGFALLALTTATAVALALRQGAIVALLGLVGGFLAPVLVSTGHPNAKMLFAYLALLQAGLLAVSRKRGWSPLAGLTLVAALFWAGGWAASTLGPSDAWVVGLFLLLSVAGVLVASLTGGGRWGAPLPTWVRAMATAGALVVAAILAVQTDYGLMEWGFVGLLAAACLVLGRFSPAIEGLAWVAAAMVCILLGSWSEHLKADDAGVFFGVAAGAMVVLGGGAWALRRGATVPARWAALAATVSLAVDLIAWNGGTEAKLDLPWGWIELGLAVVWVVLALPVARGRERLAGAEQTLAAAAAAATTLVSLAVPIELDRAWITVAWALEITALVWLAGRLRVPLLAKLAALLTAMVAVRLLANPEVGNYPLGTHPILSWLLYGYGVPVLALGAAAVLARRQGRKKLAIGTGAVSIALTVVFLLLATLQAFHPGKLGIEPTFAEWGTMTVLWLLFGCGLLFASTRAAAPADAELATTPEGAGEAPAAAKHPWPEVRWGGLVVICLALGQALACQTFVANPFLFHLSVGSMPIVNALLLAYGLPLALLLVAAMLERRVETRWKPRWAWLPKIWSASALLLLFVLVTLEVRQAFRGEYLEGSVAKGAEQYAYSAAWILLATFLLVLGLVRKSRALRLASLPVMLLAVGKVFLYDTATLSDLYRVFSFLGLGVSLLLLAWLYQRFVFRGGKPEAPA
jgi:uncharacterized membrane protein